MNSESQKEEWTAALYEELRAIAHRHMISERPAHTLQTTALVHEAYLRLSKRFSWPSRTEFLAGASHLMRQILIDYARARSQLKRGGNPLRITLDEIQLAVEWNDEVDVIATDVALRKLELLDPRQARIVEMRFFSGMSVEEIADALDVAPKTMQRDWAMARAWLRRELGKAEEADAGVEADQPGPG
jgi:RNA polymerase sigma-70 factor (ECF subfamily)